MPEQESTTHDAHGLTQHTRSGRGLLWLAGIALVAAIYAAGSPDLDATWIQGDEYIFIVNNDLVTGQGRSDSLAARCLEILTSVHADLYQPLPILSYALEWRMWGAQRVFFMRQTDLLIHAANALLVWALLLVLLRRFAPPGGAALTWLAWSLALLWGLHPALVATYAADMGRTHLLAGTFSLLALLAHLRCLETHRQRWFALALVGLLLALLSKPIVGWALLPAALEWAWNGRRAMFTSLRVYAYLAVCALFALLTMATSRESGLIDDVGIALFGDPITRSLLAISLYAGHILVPLNLATWYPPDIATGWRHPLVWIGIGIAALSAVAAILAARRQSLHSVTIASVWYWALLGPMLGLVGARLAAAQDRYLYQPLMAVLFLVGCAVLLATRPWTSRPSARARFLAAGAIAATALTLLPVSRALCADARSTLGRAKRAVRTVPNDARLQAKLAVAYEFDADHQAASAEEKAALLEAAHQATLRAATLADQHPEYLLGNAHRATFHRQLSFRLHKFDDDENSLAQALRAHDFEPDSPATWTRMAHAYRRLQRWDDARRAYERLEQIMPADAETRALRYTEYGDLLLNIYEEPAAALAPYRKALETGLNPLRAALGLARCEVLAGDLERGCQLATELLAQHTQMIEPALLIGICYTRQLRWTDADRAYRAILSLAPANYEALRGFHDVCAQTGAWSEAAAAWQTAREHERDNAVYRSFFVWAAACAAQPQADTWAQSLLADLPDNPLACYARMLIALRQDRLRDAAAWIERAETGDPMPHADERGRAEHTLELMQHRGELPPSALPAQASLLLKLGYPTIAAQRIETYLSGPTDEAGRLLAQELLEAATGPNPGE